MNKIMFYINKNKYVILQNSGLSIAFLILIIFMNYRYDNFMDSDIASQLVLSNLLAEEGSILSTNWYYATELRVFSLQLIFTPLFYLTSDWHVVRITGSIILYFILILGIRYFCHQLNIKKYFWFLGVIFLMPFSEQYFLFCLKNVNYIPSTAISFFTIGMIFNFFDSNRAKKQYLFIMLGILALLSSMNGMRQLFILYAPLLLTSFILIFINRSEIHGTFREKIKTIWVQFALISFWSTSMAMVGYIINSIILSKIFSYSYYKPIYWDSFSISDASSVIGGWLSNLGYVNGKLFSIIIIHNLVCFLIVILVCYGIIEIIRSKNKISVECKVMAYFLISSAMISLFVYAFTNMGYAPRYDLPTTVFCFPLIVLYLDKIESGQTKKKAILLSVSIGIIVYSIFSYRNYFTIDTTSELKNVISFLNDNGYQEGYATFWNANVTTELSNGDITVRVWQNDSNDFKSINQKYPWAQIINNDTIYPEGKVFWILTDEEKHNFSITKQLGSNYIKYKNKSYTVYGFENYNTMIQAISTYNIDFYNYSNVTKGNDIGGVRHLYSGGVSYGPYVTLYPGKYIVYCSGTGLDNALFNSTCILNGELIELKKENIIQTDKYIYYEIQIDEEISNFEAVFRNNSDEKISITSLQITPLTGYKMDFSNNSFLMNGVDIDGVRYLYKGGVSFGPYITLFPGKYTVTCYGTNLDNMTFDSAYNLNGEIILLQATNIEHRADYLYYEVEINEVVSNYEARFLNNSETDAGLFSIEIMKIK